MSIAWYVVRDQIESRLFSLRMKNFKFEHVLRSVNVYIREIDSFCSTSTCRFLSINRTKQSQTERRKYFWCFMLNVSLPQSVVVLCSWNSVIFLSSQWNQFFVIIIKLILMEIKCSRGILADLFRLESLSTIDCIRFYVRNRNQLKWHYFLFNGRNDSSIWFHLKINKIEC